jgi:hypothetical protein
MKELLIVTGIAIVLLILAVGGLAIKTFFKKDAQLTTCRGSGTGTGCGCVSNDACANPTEG